MFFHWRASSSYFFVGFFSVLACFEHGDQKVLFGLFGFAQKL